MPTQFSFSSSIRILVCAGFLLTSARILLSDQQSDAEDELNQIRDAINSRYLEYTNYPPVSSFAYEHEVTIYQSPAFFTWLAAHNNPNDPSSFFPDMARPPDDWPYSYQPDWELGYRYGLVSYLWLRDRGWQAHWYEEDTPRDIMAKTGWSNTLAGISLSTSINVHTSTPSTAIATVWSNNVLTVMDPWTNEYRYRCEAPYLYYRLWSVGPDGISDTADDIIADTDDDGLHDDWEISFFTNLSRNGSGNYDADNLTDAEEYIAGTNPTNSLDMFKVKDAYLSLGSTGQFVICWNSVSGRVYSVMSATNLSSSWQTNAEDISGNDSLKVYTNPPVTSPVHFYRLQVKLDTP